MKEQSEEWRPVAGLGGRYDVSNLGRLRDNVLGSIRSGHRYLKVWYDGTWHPHSLACMVATAFLEAPSTPHPVVGFKDGNHGNARFDNLFWSTRGAALQTPESRKKARIATGTPEACADRSRRMKAYNKTEKGKRQRQILLQRANEAHYKRVVCVETGVIYPSIEAAARAAGVLRGTVYASLLHTDDKRWVYVHDGRMVLHFRYYDPEQYKPKECIWKPVPVEKAAERYEVSNLGDVRYIATKHVLKPCVDKRIGVRLVTFRIEGKPRVYSVNRLVAGAFLPKPPGMTFVSHLDGDRMNDCVTNLVWSNDQTKYRLPSSKEHHLESRIRRPVKCIETGIRYASVEEAARALHVATVTIRRSCKRVATNGVAYWRYALRDKVVRHFQYADEQ